MDEVQKMFQALVNGQGAMKSELLTKIDGLDKKLSGRIDGLEEKMDTGFKKVNSRLDKLGKSLAYLEDDAPTREEHDLLENRVTKVEEKVASV